MKKVGIITLSKEEGKNQDLATPDPGHRMGKCQKHKKTHIQERQEVSPFPVGDHKAARHRQDNIAMTNSNKIEDSRKEYRLGTVSKKITGRIKLVSRYQFEVKSLKSQIKMELALY